jgi:signal transduction histidine kinase
VTAETSRRATASVSVALAIGFAVVFALWLLWSYQLMRALQQTQRNIANVHDSYVRGEQALARVRTNVLLGSIFLRDAIIDSVAPAAAAESRREYYSGELTRLRREVEQLLASYIPEVEARDREHWGRLQVELGDYWASREVAFSDDQRSAGQAAVLLRSRVVPRRNSILQILDQLAALQSVSLQRHQEEADRLYRQARARLLSVGATTLLIALVVAISASRHVSRLQRQIERARGAEQQNREDLERLSARLVGAQEQERRRLARELHDEVGQALTAVKMDIGIALRSEVAPRVREALQDARDTAEGALRGVRDLSQLLHPSMLDDFGLPATLTAYLRNFAHRTGIRAQLAETIDARLPPQVELCVYRIVQEALSNVAQHSEATACTVSLSAGGGLLRLLVEDNGRGLTTAPADIPPRRGLGLIGMRERAQALGGTFAIGDRPGGGTQIEVTLPSETLATDGQDEQQIRMIETEQHEQEKLAG